MRWEKPREVANRAGPQRRQEAGDPRADPRDIRAAWRKIEGAAQNQRQALPRNQKKQ